MFSGFFNNIYPHSTKGVRMSVVDNFSGDFCYFFDVLNDNPAQNDVDGVVIVQPADKGAFVEKRNHVFDGQHCQHRQNAA